MTAVHVERIIQLLQAVKLERLMGDCLGLGVGKQDSPTNGRGEFGGEGGGRFLKLGCRTSLVVQWLKVPLPTQGTSVHALVREDPMCCGSLGPCTTPAAPTCCSARPRACPCAQKPGGRNEERPSLAATRGSPGATTETQCNQKKLDRSEGYMYKSTEFNVGGFMACELHV